MHYCLFYLIYSICTSEYLVISWVDGILYPLPSFGQEDPFWHARGLSIDFSTANPSIPMQGWLFWECTPDQRPNASGS